MSQAKLAPPVHGVCGERVQMIHEALPHAPSLVHRQGDLGDEVDGMKGDTIKFLSDDDGNRKRGAPCGHLARHISQGLFFSSCLFSNLSDGEASFRSLDDNGELCEQLRRNGAGAGPCRCRWRTRAKLCIFCFFEIRSCGFCNF